MVYIGGSFDMPVGGVDDYDIVVFQSWTVNGILGGSRYVSVANPITGLNGVVNYYCTGSGWAPYWNLIYVNDIAISIDHSAYLAGNFEPIASEAGTLCNGVFAPSANYAGLAKVYWTWQFVGKQVQFTFTMASYPQTTVDICASVSNPCDSCDGTPHLVAISTSGSGNNFYSFFIGQFNHWGANLCVDWTSAERPMLLGQAAASQQYSWASPGFTHEDGTPVTAFPVMSKGQRGQFAPVYIGGDFIYAEYTNVYSPYIVSYNP